MGPACVRYSGPSQKLIVAFDIGTTFSGVAYAFLNPGQAPKIRYVTWKAPLLIPDPLTKSNKNIQVPRRWVRKSSLYIVLRPRR